MMYSLRMKFPGKLKPRNSVFCGFSYVVFSNVVLDAWCCPIQLNTGNYATITTALSLTLSLSVRYLSEWGKEMKQGGW